MKRCYSILACRQRRSILKDLPSGRKSGIFAFRFADSRIPLRSVFGNNRSLRDQMNVERLMIGYLSCGTLHTRYNCLLALA